MPTPVAGTWRALPAQPIPTQNFALALLTDGTVLCQNVTNLNTTNSPGTWYKLSPDATGGYLSGTWTTIAQSLYVQLYSAQVVLPSGKFLFIGGEYSSRSGGTASEDNLGSVYDPVANTWTAIATIPVGIGGVGDTPLAMFQDPSQPNTPGAVKLLVGQKGGPSYIYTVASNSWVIGPDPGFPNAAVEVQFISLPNGNVLYYDMAKSNQTGVGHSLLYLPASNTYQAQTFGFTLNDPNIEIGPAVLLPDGRVVCFGANGNVGFATTGATPTWSLGPSLPNSYVNQDGPAAMLPNGNVLVTTNAASPEFSGPWRIFEFDPVGGTYLDVTPDAAAVSAWGFAYSTSVASYASNFLMLPTGDVMLVNVSGRSPLIYTCVGSPQASWQPTITSVVNNGNGTFTLTGTRLSGISEGVGYGDDSRPSTNYPIVKLTDVGGAIKYAKTTNWSNPGVAAAGDTTAQTVIFTPPGGFNMAGATVNVIANGIASAGTVLSGGGSGPPAGAWTQLANNLSSLFGGFATSNDALKLLSDGTVVVGNSRYAQLAAPILHASLTNNVVTLTLGTPGGLSEYVGQVVEVRGLRNSAFNGSFPVLSASSSTLTYALTHANIADTPVGTVSTVQVTSSVATITTTAPHGLVAGQTAVLTGLTNSFLNGTWTLTSAASTQFQFTISHANLTSTADSGSVYQAGTLSPPGLWYKLTPTANGNYVNGTWSKLASSHYNRLYCQTHLLPNGKLWVSGGEYSSRKVSATQVEDNTGEIYDPLADVWVDTAPHPAGDLSVALGGVGDAPSSWLPDGSGILCAALNKPPSIYHPDTDSWTAASEKINETGSVETSYVALPSGNILSPDLSKSDFSGTGYFEQYNPATNTWLNAGSPAPAQYRSNPPFESGCPVLCVDGSVIMFGANGTVLKYNGVSWTQIAALPNSLACQDNPIAVLPNGNLLIQGNTSPQTVPVKMFEFSPSTGNYTDVTPPWTDGNTMLPFASNYLMLPNGQVLFLNQNSSLAMWLYTPLGSPQSAWKPTVSSVVNNGNGQYSVTGTQVNGLTEGAYFSGDKKPGSNYPIVRLTDVSGNISYARTSGWSFCGVASGSTPITFKFQVPLGFNEAGAGFTVIANGITSTPVGLPTVPTAPALSEPVFSVPADNPALQPGMDIFALPGFSSILTIPYASGYTTLGPAALIVSIPSIASPNTPIFVFGGFSVLGLGALVHNVFQIPVVSNPAILVVNLG